MKAAPQVCILTAGRGSRTGRYSRLINKALLPVDGRAMISHIIERCPDDTRFVIALGYHGQQVQDYLAIAHPGRPFTFVIVDNFDGPGSGPGYSLFKCGSELSGPFYFVTSDTFWEGKLPEAGPGSWIGVASVPEAERVQYCNVVLGGGKVAEILDKKPSPGPDSRAFIGLAYVAEPELFWEGLGSAIDSGAAGEPQIGPGFLALLARGLGARELKWWDTGTEAKYEALREKYEAFDFSKPKEFLFRADGKVIKWFADPDAAGTRVRRASLNQRVFPPVTDHRGNMFAYRFVSGKTLYEDDSIETFSRLLPWLERNLWIKKDPEPATYARACREFYPERTRQRLELFFQRAGVSEGETRVNDELIPTAVKLLDEVPWHSVSAGEPVFFHGDLQCDNIVATHDGFALLDWRPDFGGLLDCGDLYYDLAKLRGGLILNYDRIKSNRMTFHEQAGQVTLSWENRPASAHLSLLDAFASERGLDLRKIRIVTALIYLNMAGLHEPPFDRLLFYLGRSLLARELASKTDSRDARTGQQRWL